MKEKIRLDETMAVEKYFKQRATFWPKKAKDLADFLDLEIESFCEAIINGVSIDSREITPGNLFVCLKGEKNDGHDFIEEAYRKGASSFLIEREKLNTVKSQIGDEVLQNTALLFSSELKPQEVLESFAKKRYLEFTGEVVGITGSSGKTTTREIVSNLLGKKYKVLTARGNLNTEIGLSLVVANSQGDEDIWVLEYGARNRGDIAKLVDIVAPHRAVITNIGYAHLGIMGSREGIYKEKTSILKSERCKKAFIYNEDDYASRILEDFSGLDIVKAGFGKGSDVLISDYYLDQEGNASFNLEFKDEKVSVKSRLKGKHNVINAALAAAVALSFGISLEEIGESLRDFQPPKMRFEIVEFKGLKVINDAYNANPISMKSALETFSVIELGRGKKRIAILGDMLELGKRAAEFHEEIGQVAGKLGIDAIIYLGEMGKYVQKGYLSENKEGKFIQVDDHSKAAQALREIGSQGDVVLLKASRGVALEKVLSYV